MDMEKTNLYEKETIPQNLVQYQKNDVGNPINSLQCVLWQYTAQFTIKLTQLRD